MRTTYAWQLPTARVRRAPHNRLTDDVRTRATLRWPTARELGDDWALDVEVVPVAACGGVLSLAGVLEAWLSFADWMMTVRVEGRYAGAAGGNAFDGIDGGLVASGAWADGTNDAIVPVPSQGAGGLVEKGN
jgi:hypothetical protein